MHADMPSSGNLTTACPLAWVGCLALLKAEQEVATLEVNYAGMDGCQAYAAGAGVHLRWARGAGPEQCRRHRAEGVMQGKEGHACGRCPCARSAMPLHVLTLLPYTGPALILAVQPRGQDTV